MDEAESIFKSRGSKQTLTLAVKEYRDLERSVRAASLSSTEYRNHENALKQALQELERLNARKAQKAAERRRLERLQQALPELAKLRALREKQIELGPVPFLPEDFPATRQAVQERRREKAVLVKETNAQLLEIREKLRHISLRQPLLDHARAIEALNKGLERYAKDRQDRPGLEGNRRQLKRDAGDILRLIRPGIPLEEVERLYQVLAGRKALLEIGDRKELLQQVLQQAETRLARLKKDAEATARTLDGLPADIPAQNLKDAVKTAQRISTIDEELRALAATLDEERSACSLSFERQRLCPADLDALPSVATPLPATIARFAEQFAALDKEQEATSRERHGVEHEQARITSELQAMTRASEVPTEQELEEVRTRRDQGWALLRRQWIEKHDVAGESRALDPGRPLPEAYEYLVGKADAVVDRLRREAERVHAFARLTTDLELLQTRLSELSEQDRAREEQKRRLDEAWRNAWSPCGIDPLSPGEMTEWLRNFERLQDRILQMQSTRTLLEKKAAHRTAVRTLLLEALRSQGEEAAFEGEELTPVLNRAEARVEQLAESANRRALLLSKVADLDTALGHAGQEHQAATERFLAWQQEWAAALDRVGLPADTRPGEVKDLVDALQEIRGKLREADTLKARIQGLDRDIAHYEQKALDVIRAVDPELERLPLESAVDRLSAALVAERQKKTLQSTLQSDAHHLQERLRKGEVEAEDADREMAELLAMAECADEEGLVAAEERWKQHRDLLRRTQEAELRLADIGEGYGVDRLEEMAREIDPDTLPGRVEELAREIEDDLEPTIKTLHETLGMERKELERMDGNARAAEAAEQAQHLLARIRRLAENYTRLKLAAAVLDREVERYRAENQDPVLEIASRYFAELTLGSFSRLRADVDDNGAPVLIGVRPDDSRVQVRGMSSGTRDQLYLSLRLAALQYRMQKSEPMPLIVDDILVNFDDARSEATLQALAEFSRSSQVILFTHHLQAARVAEILGANILPLKS